VVFLFFGASSACLAIPDDLDLILGLDLDLFW
jgi:hypothetical protein